jgi:hypothetical protein
MPVFPLENARQLGVFLAEVVNRTARGQMDCKTATAVGSLAGALAKVLADVKDEEVEAKLEELRRLAGARPTVIRNGHGPYLTLTNDGPPSEIPLNEPPSDE